MKTRIAPWIPEDVIRSMWNRLKDIKWYYRLDGHYFPYYLIPMELVIDEYESSSGDNYICKTEDGRISANQSWMINQYLKLDQQEYYDLMELHILYEEDRPKCDLPECNEFIDWSNRLSSGYGNGRFNKHFCCKEHQLSYKYRFYPTNGIASIKSHLKAKRNSYLSQGSKFDPAQFYIGTESGLMKFGITTIGSKRMHSLYYSEDVQMDNIKIIWNGTRFQVANLEYLIGLDLNQQHEYVKFNETYKFRKAFIKYTSNPEYLSSLELDEWEKLYE